MNSPANKTLTTKRSSQGSYTATVSGHSLLVMRMPQRASYPAWLVCAASDYGSDSWDNAAAWLNAVGMRCKAYWTKASALRALAKASQVAAYPMRLS